MYLANECFDMWDSPWLPETIRPSMWPRLPDHPNGWRLPVATIKKIPDTTHHSDIASDIPSESL